MIFIPLPNRDETLVEISPILNGVQYNITYDWSSVEDRWYMTMSDLGGDIIMSSVKLTPYTDLTKLVTDTRNPGPIILMANSENVDRKGIEEATLVLFEADDVAELV